MNATGLNARTGQALSDIDHLRQSISRILTTPIGTRLMRREFGSLLPELIDQPLNDSTRMRIMAASVMAITRWEPRVALASVTMQPTGEPGALCVSFVAVSLDGPANGTRFNLDTLVRRP